MSKKVRDLCAEAGVNARRDREAALALVPEVDWGEGRTKQAFADQCDINKIIDRAQKPGGIAHVNKYPEAVYGEFEGYDLLEAHAKVNRANEIFADLPSDARNDFNNDPFAFAAFASDPENRGKLDELIPAIATPGKYFPNPVQAGGKGAGAATAPEVPEPVAAGDPPPAEPPPAAPEGGDGT